MIKLRLPCGCVLSVVCRVKGEYAWLLRLDYEACNMYIHDPLVPFLQSPKRRLAVPVREA